MHRDAFTETFGTSKTVCIWALEMSQQEDGFNISLIFHSKIIQPGAANIEIIVFIIRWNCRF
jgi:hypothetical protein